MSCTKAKKVLRSYEAGDKTPLEFKCRVVPTDEATQRTCTNGDRSVTWIKQD